MVFLTERRKIKLWGISLKVRAGLYSLLAVATIASLIAVSA